MRKAWRLVRLSRQRLGQLPRLPSARPQQVGPQVDGARLPASSRHVQVYAQDRVPAASRHVQVRSQVLGAQVRPLYFDVLQTVQDWRVPALPPPSLPRRQVPGAQGLPCVPCGVLRPLPRAQHPVQGRLPELQRASYAGVDEHVWVLDRHLVYSTVPYYGTLENRRTL